MAIHTWDMLLLLLTIITNEGTGLLLSANKQT